MVRSGLTTLLINLPEDSTGVIIGGNGNGCRGSMVRTKDLGVASPPNSFNLSYDSASVIIGGDSNGCRRSMVESGLTTTLFNLPENSASVIIDGDRDGCCGSIVRSGLTTLLFNLPEDSTGVIIGSDGDGCRGSMVRRGVTRGVIKNNVKLLVAFRLVVIRYFHRDLTLQDAYSRKGTRRW